MCLNRGLSPLALSGGHLKLIIMLSAISFAIQQKVRMEWEKLTFSACIFLKYIESDLM